MWDKITNPFPNFNGANVEVWERISNFTAVSSYRFDLQYVSIGWSNGLAPNKQQAITLTDHDPVH